MLSPFKKYMSIANDNNQRTIDYYKECGFTNSTWYATEKIHGANFSFISDGTSVTHAQRSGVIEGSFMNHSQFTQPFDEKVLRLAQHLNTPIQIVCEFYGKGIINKGSINYRNDNEKSFIAYDILLLNENKFISYPENINLLDQFEIPRVEVIAEDSFDKLMQIDLQFNSYLASKNGVISYTEGIVLKPTIDVYTEIGERVILKRVSEQFAENRPTKVEKQEVVLDESILNLISNKITDIRLGKVASKFGILPTEKSKFGQLMIEFANDITEELNTEGFTVDCNVVKKQCTSTIKTFFV